MELLAGIEWTDKAEDYFLGRGAKYETAQAMSVGEWIGADVQDRSFVKKYGERGERLLGWYCWPLRTPANRIVAIEFRNPDQKELQRHVLHDEADAHAVWTCRPDSFQRIWDGGAVWLAEGLFDLFALEWAVPSTDAVLACGRASLSKKQAESLRRLAPPYVHVVFDRDDAGTRGADFATKTLAAANLRHGVVAYGGGKDPGELWTKGGKQAVLTAFGGGTKC